MSNSLRRAVVATGLLATALVAIAPAMSASADEHDHESSVAPSVMPIRGAKEAPSPRGQARTGTVRGSGINYNGGAVMTAATTNVYVIWYGTWAAPKSTILSDFLQSVGGSPYFNINTTYFDKAGAKVKNSVTWTGETTDAYSVGKTNLSDANILTVVKSAITSGRLPADPNGVYFVLTSSDVTKSGFLTQYCGWHSYSTIATTNIKYSFVGDPTGANVASCAGQTAGSPNGDVGADAMVSVIAHELEEAVTDPNLNAWYDSRGAENADKCAWTYGTTYTSGTGIANMHLGTRDFLVQRNWLNAGAGSCVLSY